LEEILRIEKRLGAEVKSLVDPFYEKHGAGTRARADDLFFLAWDGEELIGAVRFCEEEGQPLLRGMMIREDKRGQKVGQALLLAFADHLDGQGIRPVLCLPYDYLEKFYGSIGFRTARPGEIPSFLAERMEQYNQKPKKVICMVRN
jgi:N-acetylglutamate synthase-like GNAT family acetyltransferase